MCAVWLLPVVSSARVLTVRPPVCSFAIAPFQALRQAPSYGAEQQAQGLRWPDMLDMGASYSDYEPSYSPGVATFQDHSGGVNDLY
mmetsp:Transcript_16744/g.37370  ORF Transcript_16744/g.37370 Transcript_16744/m.37370 type:complete len:86 (+) Transcript_16744:294-551(+)